MTTLQPVRGTHDLIGEAFSRHHHVIETARRVAELYGLSQWETPIFEDTRVFARTLGETSDVVTKEMYTFTDRGGDSITLRPEMTAAVCRALVTNGLTQDLPQKVFYAGPMFRYERPQKGRFRQFFQIGAEFIGPAEPLADAEVIALGAHILDELGIGAHVRLAINTLGDAESRTRHRTALVEYFTNHRASLSRDSLERLEKNPLRILDSKDPTDRTLIADAPVIDEYLTGDAATRFMQVEAWLRQFGVAFVRDHTIVRGLDYYSHTAFEFVTDGLGTQGTVMAGGRYNGLVAEMGGPDTPAIGWAAGIDRLAMLLEHAPVLPAPVVMVPVGEAAEAVAVGLLHQLRRAGIRAEIGYRGNFKRRLERANKLGARAAVIVGEAELAAGAAQVKDMASGEQQAVPFDRLAAHLA